MIICILIICVYLLLVFSFFRKSFNENTIKEGVERTVSKYKVNDLIKVTNLLMVYGSSDPWKNLGIQSFETDKSKVIFIEGKKLGRTQILYYSLQ